MGRRAQKGPVNHTKAYLRSTDQRAKEYDGYRQEDHSVIKFIMGEISGDTMPTDHKFNKKEYKHSISKQNRQQLIADLCNAAENVSHFAHQVDMEKEEHLSDVRDRDAKISALEMGIEDARDRAEWWKKLALKYSNINEQLLVPYEDKAVD